MKRCVTLLAVFAFAASALARVIPSCPTGSQQKTWKGTQGDNLYQCKLVPEKLSAYGLPLCLSFDGHKWDSNDLIQCSSSIGHVSDSDKASKSAPRTTLYYNPQHNVASQSSDFNPYNGALIPKCDDAKLGGHCMPIYDIRCNGGATPDKQVGSLMMVARNTSPSGAVYPGDRAAYLVSSKLDQHNVPQVNKWFKEPLTPGSGVEGGSRPLSGQPGGTFIQVNKYIRENVDPECK